MRVLGIVFFAVGIVLFLFGLNSSQVFTEKVVEGVTGRFTTATMLYLIGGVALIAGGGYLFFFGEAK